MKYKLIFWDWMGTLFGNDFLGNSRIVDLTYRGIIPSDLDLKNLSYNSSFQIKNELRNYSSIKIPTTWWLVNQFTKLNIYQVIVSNGLRSSVINELKDYNPFELILTSEEFEPKPSLEMLFYAMNNLSITDKNEILFIGDSIIDENTAKILGVKFFKIDNYYESVYLIAKELSLI